MGLPLPVISDGRIVKESLAPLGITEEKIITILNKNALKPKNVFLMTLDRYENINIIKKRS